jgi:nucleoside-diphosphate-sugar epimerase
MNVLITGGGGFIGGNLAQDQMRKGKNVRVVDLHLGSLKGTEDHGRLEVMQGDIRDESLMKKALKGIELVFHLASAHLSVTTSEKEYWETNVEAARSLVRLSQAAGVRRFVHCSSVGIYGEITHPPATENYPCRPDLVYEKTKLAGERALLEFYRETGYPISIIRPVWVYGPSCPRTAKLFRAVRKRRFIIAGSGQTLRHCVYISDLLEAFDLCARREEAIGEDFIIGDSSAVTVAELVGEIASIMNVPPPSIKVPMNVMTAMCTAVEALSKFRGKEPPLSRRTLKFFTNNTSFDITKARSLLRYSPRFTLAEGLRQTYQSLLQQGCL